MLQAGEVAGGPGEGAREKYFEEKNAFDRLVRVAEALERAVLEIRQLRVEVKALSQHEHGKDGQIVVPLASLLAGHEESYFFRNPLGREKQL